MGVGFELSERGHSFDVGKKFYKDAIVSPMSKGVAIYDKTSGRAVSLPIPQYALEAFNTFQTSMHVKKCVDKDPKFVLTRDMSRLIQFYMFTATEMIEPCYPDPDIEEFIKKEREDVVDFLPLSKKLILSPFSVRDATSFMLCNIVRASNASNKFARTPDGRFIVYSPHPGAINLWNAVTEEVEITFKSHRFGNFRHLCVSGDGNRVFSIINNVDFLTVWDKRKGTDPKWDTKSWCAMEDVVGMASSYDGDTLVVMTHAQIEVWRKGKFENSMSFESVYDRVMIRENYLDKSVAKFIEISPCGTFAIANHIDCLKVYNLETQKHIGRIRGSKFSDLAFSPSGAFLINLDEKLCVNIIE